MHAYVEKTVALTIWAFIGKVMSLLFNTVSRFVTLMAKSEEELKNFLMRVKGASEKAVLKLSIPKTKIMASSPITSWQIDRETMKTVTDFIFGDSKNHCRC